jgi:hypothetical protein
MLSSMSSPSPTLFPGQPATHRGLTVHTARPREKGPAMYPHRNSHGSASEHTAAVHCSTADGLAISLPGHGKPAPCSA